MRPLARPRARLALVALGLFVLVAIFADLLACEAPLVAHYDGKWLVAPALTGHTRWTPEQSQAVDRSGWALWAPVRAGPATRSARGANDAASSAHWLGTDANAHDVVAVAIHGTRTIVVIAGVSLLCAAILGLFLGALAGYGPPVLDGLLARSVELTGAVPTVMLIALLRAGGALPAGLSLVLVIAALRGVEIARLTRGEVLRVGGSDYVMAARALGATAPSVVVRHVLPHVLGPLLVSLTFGAAAIVALEAALTFLGLGLPKDSASWGALLGHAGGDARTVTWLLPAFCVVLATASLYVVAEALDDVVSARRGGPSRV